MKRAGVLTAGLLAASCSLGALDGFSSGSVPAAIDDGGGIEAAAPDAGPDVIPAPLESGAPEAGPLPRTCAEVLAASPNAADGFFQTSVGEVYCNMTSAGGGWTLVARSGGPPGPAPRFGWNYATGTARATDAPYSLGVLRIELPFKELLVGSRNEEGFALVNAYKLAISRDDLLGKPLGVLVGYGIATVHGSCAPPGGPSMLRFAGLSASEDVFYFRDVPQTETKYGLFAAFFDTRYDDCAAGGLLQPERGQIFVR